MKQRKRTIAEQHPEIDSSRIRELAVSAGCHPDTLRKFLIGEDVRGGHLRGRIEKTLRDAGLLP